MSLNNMDHPPEPLAGSFTRLLRFPPKPRLVAGVLLMMAGVCSTIALWDKGVVWGLTLFGLVAGLFLSISGAAGIWNQARRRKMLESIAGRKEEILQRLMDAKREGKNPVRCLNDQGIHDPEVRTWFLEAMNERSKSGGPS
jgi:hypothetical protein